MSTPQHRRLSMSEIIERLTPESRATGSVTLKLSAQGQFMPEVVVTAGMTDEQVETMISQAVRAFLAVGEVALQQKQYADDVKQKLEATLADEVTPRRHKKADPS